MPADFSSDTEALVSHLVLTAGLSRSVARRVVDDVLAHHLESVEAYVRRRHRTLAEQGCKNDVIYRRLADEVASRPFRASPASARQIRRMIYG